MRVRASRAALRAPASRLRPLTPSPASGVWLTCRFARAVSAGGGCHLYFAHGVTFLTCADSDSDPARRVTRSQESKCRVTTLRNQPDAGPAPRWRVVAFSQPRRQART